MKSETLFKLVLKMASRPGRMWFNLLESDSTINFLADPEITTTGMLYKKVSEEITFFATADEDTLEEEYRNDRPFLSNLSYIYLGMVGDNTIVPVKHKLEVCKKMVNFRCLLDNVNFADSKDDALDEITALAHVYLDCVRGDLYKDRTTSSTSRAWKAFKEALVSLIPNNYWCDYYIKTFSKAVKEFRANCKEGDYIWPPAYFYFSFFCPDDLTKGGWSGRAALDLISMITNPFPIHDEK